MKQSKRHADGAVQSLEQLCRTDYYTAIILSVTTLGLYAFTAAPGVTLEDSGDFINGVLTLGVVHPPGYPLYTVLGHLFSFLPFGELAYRVNLFSALWGALCLGILFLNFRILNIQIVYATFTSLFLGFTSVFWSKTGVTEVYSFNAFLLAAVVFWILNYNRDKKAWQLYLTGLFTGLALANHYPLAILSGLGLLFLLDRKDLGQTEIFKAFLFLVLGVTPYLYLFIQAYNTDLQYNFGKISNIQMVIDHILRSYDSNEHGGTYWDKLILGIVYLKSLVTSFWLSSLLLISGIVLSLRSRWPYRYPFLIAALTPSFGLILILNIPSGPVFQSYLFDFSVPSFLFMSFFLAFGLNTLFLRYAKSSAVSISILIILLLTQVGINFRFSSHHNDRLADIWGTELLASLKPNSILILCASSQFHLYYLQLVRGLRKDVTIYDRYSLWTRENLFAPELLFKLQGNPIEYQRKREHELISNSTRPIYYTCKDVPEDLNATYTYTPYLIRVDNKHAEAADVTKYSVSDRLLETLVYDYPKSEFWLDLRRQLIFSRFISYFGGHGQSEAHRVVDYLKKTKFYSDPSFTLSLANDLYFYENHKLAKTFYDHADQLSTNAFSTTDLAVYCNLLGNARDYDRALGICMRQERSSDPCDANTINTRQTIAAIHKEKGDWPKVAQYARKILECQPEHPVARSYMQSAMQKIEKGQPTTELIAIDESK